MAIVTNSKDRSQDIALELEFRPEDHATLPGLNGMLSFAGADYPIQPGWQHVWNAKTNPAFGNKDRVLNVVLDNTEDTEGPQGDSLATIKLSKAGSAAWSGTLADGRKVTGAFTASPDGEVPFYASIPYAGGGAVIALLATESVGELLGVVDDTLPTGRWMKRAPVVPPKAIALSYPDGFNLPLDIDGAQFVAPAKGQLLFGNQAVPIGLSFGLSGGGISSSAQLGARDPVILAAELQAGNKLVVPPQPGLASTLKMAPTFTGTNGLMSLSAKLSDASTGTTPVARTLTCNGLYIPDLNDPLSSEIRGFFLLPELPGQSQSAAATPIRSGALEVLAP